MPIYVGLVNWTDQGTKEFRGSVERANGFRGLVEQAGGRAREMVWTMGEYDFITVFEAHMHAEGLQAAVNRRAIEPPRP
jgi:uncharacterized protein with GYD domain